MNFECKATMQKEEKQLQLDVIFFSFTKNNNNDNNLKNVCTVYKKKKKKNSTSGAQASVLLGVVPSLDKCRRLSQDGDRGRDGDVKSRPK